MANFDSVMLLERLHRGCQFGPPRQVHPRAVWAMGRSSFAFIACTTAAGARRRSSAAPTSRPFSRTWRSNADSPSPRRIRPCTSWSSCTKRCWR